MRGIEPRTSHMQSERSTTELHPHWLTHIAAMAEWLRRWTWNPMGISLAGSNPARSELLSEGTIVSVNSSCGAFIITRARLAQSVEHQTFNLRVKGSSPLLGASFFFIQWNFFFSTFIFLFGFNYKPYTIQRRRAAWRSGSVLGP